jgi:hypothetical protein
MFSPTTLQRRPRLALAAALALVFAATGAAHATCNAQLFYGDFKIGFITHFPGSPVTAGPIVPTTDPNPLCSGWSKTTLTLQIPTGCTKAVVLVGYDGLPVDWTLDIGNSPSNDGFGGDAGNNGGHNAELWILGANLEVANASTDPTKVDNPLIIQTLGLQDSGLQFNVMNQAISWGNPYTLLQTPASQNLFFPPTIYIGVNQVVAGDPGRDGCGLRTVLISFE